MLALAFVLAQALTFADALAAAAEHPEVRAAEAASAAHADARIRRTNGASSLLVQPGWRTRPRSDEGPELQLVAGHTFTLAREGRRVGEAAEADRRALHAEVRGVLLTRELAVADAWLALHATTARIALLAEEDALLATYEERLARARSLGAALESDLAMTRAERAELESRRLALARERQAAERALAEALGASSPVSVTGDLPTLPPPRSPPETFDAFPLVELARARRDAEVADLRVSLASRAATLFVGAQFQTEAPDARMAYAVLQIQGANAAGRSLDRARGAAAIARAESLEDSARRDAARLFALAYERARLADEQLARHREHVVPALEALVEGARRRRELGEQTLFEELDHRRRALEARDRERQLAEESTRARAQLQLLHDALSTRGADR